VCQCVVLSVCLSLELLHFEWLWLLFMLLKLRDGNKMLKLCVFYFHRTKKQVCCDVANIVMLYNMVVCEL